MFSFDLSGASPLAVALAAAIVLVHSLLGGVLSGLGWARAAERDLRLASMLSDGSPMEREARDILRTRAASRVIGSEARREAMKTALGRAPVACFFVGAAGLLATGLCAVCLMAVDGEAPDALAYAVAASFVAYLGGDVAWSAVRARERRGSEKPVDDGGEERDPEQGYGEQDEEFGDERQDGVVAHVQPFVGPDVASREE